jgi:hypothetical protein
MIFVTEALSRQGFYLPPGLTLSRDQIHHICLQIKKLVP